MLVETYKIHRNTYTCNGKLYCIQLCCVPLSQSRTRFVKKKRFVQIQKKLVCCYIQSLQDKELKGKHNLDIEWSKIANNLFFNVFFSFLSATSSFNRRSWPTDFACPSWVGHNNSDGGGCTVSRPRC